MMNRKHPNKQSSISVPSEFYCSLSHQVMDDPVVNEYGYLFDRKAIQRWIVEGKEFCPCTGNPMSLGDLMSARKLHERIYRWKKANPEMDADEGCVLRIKMAMRQAALCQ
eukprot:Nitzschia sp. Nitz4//scaffold496_size4744//1381//1710//NITZ4_009234-RA/size4744-processed-gene-0.0-mRNA-1//1//CDS//3329553076//459//frame0